MSKPKPNLLTAIDVGSAKTCVLVGEITESGLRYLAHGVTDSRGSRKGVIVDLDKAASSVQKAAADVETATGMAVERAIVGVAGAHVRGVNAQGGISLGTRAREIGKDDVSQAVAKAKAIALPPDREILHILPQEFILDDQGGIREPTGMTGSKLEVRVHLVTVSTSAVQNIVTAVNRAGIHVDDTVFEPLACGDCVLRGEERELGVCLAEIGAGSTDLIVFYEGTVVHTAVVPLGGDHFTNDVSVGVRTPLAHAEKIKRLFGCAVVTRIPEPNEIEVPSVGDRPSRLVSQRLLGEILEPRARELFEMVRDNLRQAGVADLCGAGLVLTGGAARLKGMQEIAEQILRKPARLAVPAPLSRMPASLADPEFATAIGMMFYGFRARLARGTQEQGFAAKLKSLFARRSF